MKILFILATSFLIMGDQSHVMSDQEHEIQNGDNLKCNNRILQYYGFEGWSIAKEPPLEEQDGGRRFCEGMEYTCCSRDDFLKSKQMWGDNSLKIKGYLTKIFRIIQKIVMMQSSFIEMASRVSDKPNEYCKKIDTTFFNAPVAFDQIYSYLKTAFQSMAFVQKGFYCTICNVENHKYMMIKQDFSRLMIAMSKNSCDDLINYFKEFIMYKVYYLDPFVINANFMFNCYEDTDKYKLDFDYQATYPEIKDCVENGNSCANVCREFRFGRSSDLFMGDLSKYERFLGDFEEFAQRENVSLSMANDELYVPEYKFEDTEFFKGDKDLTTMDQEELNYGKISDYQILVNADGIDLFGTAARSNYFLTDQTTTIEKTRIFNTNVGEGTTSSLLGDGQEETDLHSPNEIKEEMMEEEKQIQAARVREEQEKFESLGIENRPSSEELNNLNAQIQEKENARQDYTQKTGQINDFNPDSSDDRYNNFGSAGEIGNGIGILNSLSVMIIALLGLTQL